MSSPTFAFATLASANTTYATAARKSPDAVLLQPETQVSAASASQVTVCSFWSHSSFLMLLLPRALLVLLLLLTLVMLL